MRFCYVWVPGWVCVCEYRADKLFVYLRDVFLGVTIGGGGKSSEDVQASLCFGVDSVGVVPERHSSVIGHSKDGGSGIVWNRAIVEGYYGLLVVFARPGGDEG